MANHGWLPRSGKNIDLAMLRHAVAGAYNYEPTSFDDAFAQTLAFNLTTTENSSTIHLRDLARHDDVEFDGSLSRNDIYFGDNLYFDPTVWKTVADNLHLYETLGSEVDNYVTVELAAKARAVRVEEAKRINPTFNASTNEIQESPGTTGFILLRFGMMILVPHPKHGLKRSLVSRINLNDIGDFIRIGGTDNQMEDERIPFREGYKVPSTPRNFANVTAMTLRVSEVKV
ncbi:Chloroperoxidase [Penicillium malachiteum]|nr:Chloroperoxidase [Penicillium malachiteum]